MQWKKLTTRRSIIFSIIYCPSCLHWCTIFRHVQSPNRTECVVERKYYLSLFLQMDHKVSRLVLLTICNTSLVNHRESLTSWLGYYIIWVSLNLQNNTSIQKDYTSVSLWSLFISVVICTLQGAIVIIHQRWHFGIWWECPSSTGRESFWSVACGNRGRRS